VRSLVLAAVAVGFAAPLRAADPPTHQIPYRLTDTKHVLVRAKLNGQGPFNFILDTGAPAVFVPKVVAKKIGLKVDGKGWGSFDQFELEGGVTVPKTRCRVEDLFQLEGMNGMGLAGVELHGVIGANVLARFKITYDFTADKLTFVTLDYNPPDPKGLGGKGGQGGLEVIGPVMKMMAGFMGIKPNFTVTPVGFLGIDAEAKKGGVFVTKVFPDAPADKAGIEVGDKLDTVRSNSLDDLRDLTRELAKTTAGDRIKVQIVRDGKTQTLNVKLGGGL